MKHIRPLKKELILSFFKIMVASFIATIMAFSIFIIVFLNDDNHLKPANYYEKQIPEIEEYVRKHNDDLLNIKFEEQLKQIIPQKGIQFQVIDDTGKGLYGTSKDELYDQKKPLPELINKTVNNRNNITYYLPLFNEDHQLRGSLILNYDIAVTTTNPWIVILVITLFVSPFIYVILFTYFFSSRLVKKIVQPVRELINASKRIRDKDLDFKIQYEENNEIGELSKSFEHMRSNLEESLNKQWQMEQERKDMVAAIVHDLRTPLTILRGHIEGLQTGLWKQQRILLKYLNTMNHNVIRMSNLLNDFQLSTEVDHQHFQLIPVEINVSEFLNNKLNDYERLLNNKKLTLEYEIYHQPNTHYFELDKHRISQVIDNLVMNSLRFTPGGGIIRIEVYMTEENFEFHIIDSGPGFSTQGSAIFQKFFQEDRSRSQQKGHAGLGLYIVKTIVEKHHGKVFAENYKSSTLNGAHVFFKIQRLRGNEAGTPT